MSVRTPKVRVTKTLLDAWLWSFKRDDGYEDFLKTLNREKSPPTKAMLDGQKFENCVNNVLDGAEISEDHEWYNAVIEMSQYLVGSQQQVVLFRETVVDGQLFLLHGVLDYLRAGVIYDCKFSKNYHLNKYLSSTTQHSLYLALVPEARRFEYLSSDGTWVYKEIYPREIVDPIEPSLRQFMAYLKKHDLWKTYIEKWRVN